MSLRGTTAITGIGELKPSRDPGGRTTMELMAQAAIEAVRDAGLERKDIDGLVVAAPMSWSPMVMPSVVAEFLGLQPGYAGLVDLGGASAAGTVWRAAAAINAGACRHVLCLSGEVQDPKAFYQQQRGRTPPGLSVREFEAPYGPVVANTGYALIAQRHMHQFGTTKEQMAKVAVDERTNACANPNATFYGKPLTIEDVLGSPMVVDPLHLLEIVMPCCGAAAIVVSRAEDAASRPHPPVYLLGFGEQVTHSIVSCAPSLTETPIVYTAQKAYQMAGVSPQDMDLASVYDCYTIMVILTLEDAGFCEKGKGGPFVQEHDLTYKGDFPVNTHGGQLSFGQPGLAGGASHITEAVRQLRGEAGERQLRNCDLAFVNGNGGIISEEVSLVLGNSR